MYFSPTMHRFMRIVKVRQRVFWLSFLLLTCLCASQEHSGPAEPHLVSEVRLPSVDSPASQNCGYSGKDVPPDLSLLYDDSKTRLVFVDDSTLIVYRSWCHAQDREKPSRRMDAVFLNPQTGAITGKQSWPTDKRRWFNDRWDTEARIMSLREGFLVHAGNTLHVYSSDRREKAALVLNNDLRSAVVVPPSGRTIHLQRINNDNTAKGEWLSAESLTPLSVQSEMGGITSASDDTVADWLNLCLKLQQVGKKARNLYCVDRARAEYPMFLTDAEILLLSSKGFAIFSTDGDRLWSRESDVRIGAYKKSLSGNRFAIRVSGKGHYEQVRIPSRTESVFVYDRIKRAPVCHLEFSSSPGRIDFDLDPGGSWVAVLIGDDVRVYRLPS